MVPSRIRLSAVGRSRRLIVEARGFRSSAPVLVFYARRTKSRLTAGPRRAYLDPSAAAPAAGLIELAEAPRVGRMLQVLRGLDQQMRVPREFGGVPGVAVLGAVG